MTELLTKLAAARRRLNLSQRAAAAKAGVSQPTWRDVELGNKVPRWDTAKAMLAAVGLKVTIGQK